MTTAPSNAIQRDIRAGERLPEFDNMAKRRFQNLENKHPSKYLLRVYGELLNDFVNLTQGKFDQLSDDLGGAEGNLINYQDLINSRQNAISAITIVTYNTSIKGASEFMQATFEYIPKNDVDARKFANEYFVKCQEELNRRRDEYVQQGQETTMRPYLPRGLRADFSQALKLMPTVQWLSQEDRQAFDWVDPGNAAGGKTFAEWKNGGSLTDSIYFANYVNKNPQYTADQVPPKHRMYRRVLEADAMLKKMVEPDVLNLLDRPVVYIVRSRSFRAFQSQSNVHVSKVEAMPVVVHEVSHYLEDYLPNDLWTDVHAMLRARHEDRSQSYRGRRRRKTKQTTLGTGDNLSKKEGRYRGKYGTGKYTSKAYGEHGSTEVTSMTMEWLANPQQANRLIDRDPQQAAIVLRQMRPNEYAAVQELREFDQYLPGRDENEGAVAPV